MSNKTPRANAKRTKSALKIIGLSSLLLILGAAAFLVIKPEPPAAPSAKNNYCLKLAGSAECAYHLEAANTNEEQLRGLSGRDGLARGAGMIFVFDQPSGQCFWMKDMRFSIDIVWLSSQKEIIKIEENVAPETYPQSFCANDAQYVIELGDGEARKSGLSIGQKLDF